MKGRVSLWSKKFFAVVLMVSLFAGSISQAVPVKAEDNPVPEETQEPEESQELVETQAAEESGSGDSSAAAEDNTANLRLIFTSDIHGQVTTEDYETGKLYTTGGLSRAATLIKDARAEVNESNSMLFDLGDSLYDYTTDYIYNYSTTERQPVYKALATLGYDAMTLGNHDFDYSLSYIKNQLAWAGLTDKVVLSNVWNANTKAHIWAENKIITKSLVTQSGQKISVKVGLIGETVPSLSKKRTSYKGILETEDIVKNVKKEVTLLKNKGADIIVVIAHSGVGEEKPAEMDNNTGYALTKVSGVDAVLCGHLHTDFPTESENRFDNLPGVDKTTGLTNGKPLVEVENRGASIGIADLKLASQNGKVVIKGSSTDVRKVNEKTAVDQTINTILGDWSKTFMNDCSQILSEIDSEAQLQNYFGTQEDNDAIQLLNNIKMSFGINYINNTATAYKNYNTIAASSYIKYGADDDSDYVDIRDDFKKSNIYDLVAYRTGLYLYKMTGAQIREWLEWSASCYEVPGENQVAGMDYQYTLQPEYVDDWSGFYVFDGIEYKIDTTQMPRYSQDGNVIQDSRRITSLTRNGVPIKDTDVFVVATHRLPSNTLFDNMNPTKIVSTSTDKYRQYIQSYIEKISMTGSIKSCQDNNWQVNYSDQGKYLFTSGKGAYDYLETKPWIAGTVEKEYAQYFLADFSKISTEDTTGPCLAAVPLTDTETNKDVVIAVQATDVSGVASIQYISGKYSASNSVWNSATNLTGKSFAIKTNGTYSVCATDNAGNRTVTYVRVLNINRSILDTPVVETYSNRKQYIEGKAEASAKIYFKIENGTTYSTTVGKNGKFKYKLPPQKAGTKIYVYAVDGKGRTSARAIVTVKRTGPNRPTLNQPQTNSKKITGKVNDSYAYPVIIVNDKTVYVQNANVKAMYKKSSLYNKKYKVVTGKIKLYSNGTFALQMSSYWKAKTSIKLRTVDAIGRNSLSTSKKVKQVVPNAPVISSRAASNLAKSIHLYTDEKVKSAAVKIGKKTYVSTKGKYNSKTKKYCFTIKMPRTDTTTDIKAYFVNVKGRSGVRIYHTYAKVPDAPAIKSVYAGSSSITGTVKLVASDSKTKPTVSGTKTKVYAYVNGQKRNGKIKSDGSFIIRVPKLKKGDKVVLQASNKRGKSLKKTFTVKKKPKSTNKSTSKTTSKTAGKSTSK